VWWKNNKTAELVWRSGPESAMYQHATYTRTGGTLWRAFSADAGNQAENVQESAIQAMEHSILHRGIEWAAGSRDNH
jgi:hypothetical protein